MKSAVWVTWSEKWDTPLLRFEPVKGLNVDEAERHALIAQKARELFFAVPAGRA